MSRQIVTTVAALAAAASLSAGAVALAQGASTKSAHARRAHHHVVKHATRARSETVGTDTDQVQAGDQTSTDPAGSSMTGQDKSATETSSESLDATGNDGPGGHEDAPGAEVDHQAEGSE